MCCKSCETWCSDLMCQMTHDMETQRTHYLGLQIEELLRSIKDQRTRFIETTQQARQALPPEPIGPPIERTNKGPYNHNGRSGKASKQTKDGTEQQSEHLEFTSVLDMEDTTGLSRI